MSGNAIGHRYRLIDQAIDDTVEHFRGFSTIPPERDILRILGEKLPKGVSIQLGQEATKAIGFIKQRVEALQTNL